MQLLRAGQPLTTTLVEHCFAMLSGLCQDTEGQFECLHFMSRLLRQGLAGTKLRVQVRVFTHVLKLGDAILRGSRLHAGRLEEALQQAMGLLDSACWYSGYLYCALSFRADESWRGLLLALLGAHTRLRRTGVWLSLGQLTRCLQQWVQDFCKAEYLPLQPPRQAPARVSSRAIAVIYRLRNDLPLFARASKLIACFLARLFSLQPVVALV